MTRLITVLALLSALPAIAAPPTVKFEARELQGLVYFAVMASAGSNAQEASFFGESGPRESDKQALDRFRSALALANLPRSNESDGAKLLELIAAQARSIADLGRRLGGLFPPKARATIVEVLSRYEAPYRSRVWKPRAKSLARQVRELEAISKKALMGEILTATATFYDAKWPEDVPITVSAVPVVGSPKTTRAHAVETLGLVEVAEGTDLARQYGVIVHALCRSLWLARDRRTTETVESWFADAPNPYKLLDEALATVIGNMMSVDLAGEKSSETEVLYGDEVVDGYARSLHKTVRKYLLGARAMDEKFAARAKKKFAQRFPDPSRRIRLRFRHLQLLTDPEVAPTDSILAQFRANIGNETLKASSPIDHPATVEMYHAATDTSTLIVTRPDDLDWLARYEQLRTGCADIADAAAQSPAIYVATGSNGRLHVILFAGNKQETSGLMERLANIEVLPGAGLVSRMAR